MKSKQKTALILILLLVLSFVFYVGFKQGQNSFEENGLLISEGNLTYYKHFDNYYGLYYENNENGIILQIQNPCLTFEKVSGESMKPYYDNESIIIIDTCFAPENLEVGDIVLYYVDWDMATKLHHRIIDINYDKKWIKTKGDALEDEDNFVGFDKIYGKEIGVLNILEDKKVVIEQTNGTEYNPKAEQICVCSSNNILKVCYTDRETLMSDNFVITNNLKEENCIIENEK